MKVVAKLNSGTERKWLLPFVQPSLPSGLTIVADSTAEVCSAWKCAAMHLSVHALSFQQTCLIPCCDFNASVAVQHLQAVVDYICSATSAAILGSEGVQLLRQAAPCGSSHGAGQHIWNLQSGGAVSDLADCLGITHDGRLTMRNVPEGTHKLYLPRIHQVQRCHNVGYHEPTCSQGCQGSFTDRRKDPLDCLALGDGVPEVIALTHIVAFCSA